MCLNEKMTSRGIIRGIKGTWNSYCCLATCSQRANWSAGTTFWLLLLLPAPGLDSLSSYFPVCAHSHTWLSHRAICIVEAGQRCYVTTQISGQRWNGTLAGRCLLCFLRFLTQTYRLIPHRAADWKVSPEQMQCEKPVWLQILLFLFFFESEEKQLWEIGQCCWFSRAPLHHVA